MLGQFEYLLITAALRLGEDAYGASVWQEVERTLEHGCSIGALYTTLDRLESKGFVETWTGGATPRRGGRSRRMVRVTEDGVRAAKSFYKTVLRASEDLKWKPTYVGVRP